MFTDASAKLNGGPCDGQLIYVGSGVLSNAIMMEWYNEIHRYRLAAVQLDRDYVLYEYTGQIKED